MIDAIVIDSREPAWVQNLTFPGVPVTVAELEAGDAWLSVGSDLIVCERKTPDDLLASIKDDRLFSQAARSKALTPWAYLVITGTITPANNGYAIIKGQPTQWEYNAVMGALTTAQELGMFVTWCKGDADYGAALVRIANRDRHGLVPINPNKNTRNLRPGEAMLAALPGIGVTRTKALLQHKPTAALALAALIDPDEKIPGIGDVTKRQCAEAIGLIPGSVILVNEIAF